MITACRITKVLFITPSFGESVSVAININEQQQHIARKRAGTNGHDESISLELAKFDIIELGVLEGKKSKNKLCLYYIFDGT